MGFTAPGRIHENFTKLPFGYTRYLKLCLICNFATANTIFAVK